MSVARCARGLVAVLYRRAGLVALCALAGTAVSQAWTLRQPHVVESGAQQDNHLAETRAALRYTLLTQASDDLRRAEDDVVALLVRDGRRAGGRGLKLDLDPVLQARGRNGGRTASLAGLNTHATPLPLRLDEARQFPAEDAGNVRTASLELAGPLPHLDAAMRVNTAFEADLDRLDGARQLARARLAGLQHQRDRNDLSMRLNPAGAETRVGFKTPDLRAGPHVGNKRFVALLGTAGGLLLGLLLGGLRELGGGRMRSARETESALGVPVLGAIPTLSAKARDTYLGTARGALPPAVAQPE
jgi:hypothetical protein